jgi:hypothetical protein
VARGLRRRSTDARLLRSWVRIPLGARMSVCCECCVLSGSGFCDELITRPEESYGPWCVVCDLEKITLVNEDGGQDPLGGYGTKKKRGVYIYIYVLYIRHFRSQWPRGLRRRSAAARLLRLWVWIPSVAWMFVVIIVCCQIEVFVMRCSIVQRSPTDCGASLCLI